jgi:hypothetical protein
MRGTSLHIYLILIRLLGMKKYLIALFTLGALNLAYTDSTAPELRKIICSVEYNSNGHTFEGPSMTENAVQQLSYHHLSMRDAYYNYELTVLPRFEKGLFHDFELKITNPYGQIMALSKANVTNEKPYEGMSMNVGAPPSAQLSYIHYSCGICDENTSPGYCGLPPPAPKATNFSAK